VAVVGFAAFSPSSGEPTEESLDTAVTIEAPASARVASAILALRVSDAETRTATTTTSDDLADANAEPETATITETTTDSGPSTTVPDPTTSSSSTTTAPSTTQSPTTAAAPTTTSDSTPPTLTVTSPDDGDTVDDRVVTFAGTTERGASVTSGPYEAEVDEDGSWSLQLVLSEGPNGALFTATDAAGNSTSVRIVVTYEPPVATTTTTQPPAATTTTTAPAPSPKWSPLWPADAGGKRNVEAWRPLVEKHWPASLVDCALNLIDLESQGDPRAYNSSTSAEGLFQHLSKYWKGRAAAAGFKDSDGLYASPYHAEANIAAAWLIASGSEPWHRPWSVNPFYGACQE
jgi:hypothetical protein